MQGDVQGRSDRILTYPQSEEASLALYSSPGSNADAKTTGQGCPALQGLQM